MLSLVIVWHVYELQDRKMTLETAVSIVKQYDMDCYI